MIYYGLQNMFIPSNTNDTNSVLIFYLYFSIENFDHFIDRFDHYYDHIDLFIDHYSLFLYDVLKFMKELYD
jgi:hypothetical protein